MTEFSEAASPAGPTEIGCPPFRVDLAPHMGEEALLLIIALVVLLGLLLRICTQRRRDRW